VTKAAGDPHVCHPPHTADLPKAHGPILFECVCGRQWHIEHFHSERTGEYLGCSWILEDD
jgi:hypothetical protein